MEYKFLGKRIYYSKKDGRIIFNTGEMQGWVNPTTTEDDWRIYSELQKYNKTEVDFIELQFGEFKTEFAECTSYRVNPDTKVLEFDYTPIPPSQDVPHTPTVHERLDALEKTNEEQDLLISELAMM